MSGWNPRQLASGHNTCMTGNDCMWQHFDDLMTFGEDLWQPWWLVVTTFWQPLLRLMTISWRPLMTTLMTHLTTWQPSTNNYSSPEWEQVAKSMTLWWPWRLTNLTDNPTDLLWLPMWLHVMTPDNLSDNKKQPWWPWWLWLMISDNPGDGRPVNGRQKSFDDIWRLHLVIFIAKVKNFLSCRTNKGLIAILLPLTFSQQKKWSCNCSAYLLFWFNFMNSLQKTFSSGKISYDKSYVCSLICNCQCELWN